MAAFTLFECFVEDIAEKVHNLGADTLTVALTNTAPTAGTDDELVDITEVSYTYCSSRVLTLTSSSQASGVYSLILQDLTLSASGGSVGPFRYVVIYNDTATNDELIGYSDYGSSITLNDGEDLALDLPAGAIFSITIT